MMKNRQSQWKNEWVLEKHGFGICQMPMLAKNIKRSGTVITGYLEYSFLVGDLQAESLKHFHGSGALKRLLATGEEGSLLWSFYC